MKDGIRKIAIYLVLLSACMVVHAQEITVNVMPVQRILPPQVMQYINNPGNYFNVQLINNSQVTQNVYICMTIEQIHPSTGLSVIVPAKRQPQTPFTVAPGQVRQLTMVELKNMFSHVVKSEVQSTSGLFDSYYDGTFGLFPEGLYEASLTAYKWDPALANPVPVSNPITGKCQFNVCYKAQAPQFIQPMSIGMGLRDLSVAKLNRQNPQLTWREPVLACNSLAQRFTYDVKIVELMVGQQPDDAIDYNPAVYLQSGIMTPVATIPKGVLDRMRKDATYVAQVTARTKGTSARMMNYMLVENEGKSPYRLFRIVDSDTELLQVAESKPLETKSLESKIKEPVKPQEPKTQEPEPTLDVKVVSSGYVEEKRELSVMEKMARKMFIEEDVDVKCSDKVNITNTTPTRVSEIQLKGRTVDIGQYQMKIDEIRKVSGKDYYEGKGHVEWKPLGFRCMIAVKFDSLKINTDNIVYGGRAVSCQSEIDADNPIEDISKYYADVKKGKWLKDQFLKSEIRDMHLPVQIPRDYNSSPVDIQIVSMKFMPTNATMDIMGEFALPNSNYLKNDIMLLGAPRLCVAPDQLLPETGALALLGDFTSIDLETSFDMTFKAPTNLLKPGNGSVVRWNDNKFGTFDVDADITIPALVKVDASGNRTMEHTKLNIQASVSDWEDWFAETNMDTFESVDLKDWTFMPGDLVVFDHSKYRNANVMKLPIGFNKTKAGLHDGDSDAAWQGLYIKKIGIVFPKMLSVSDKNKNWNGRLRLEDDEMLVDASGCTLQFSENNLLSLNTANVGGWGISMKELRLDILQNSFVNSYFTGQIKTPLDGLVTYCCDLYAQGKDVKGMTDPSRSAYILKPQQIDGLKFDFLLGNMTYDKDQTYFLVEAGNQTAKETATKVELCMGGDMTISVGRAKLKSMGKVGAFVDSKIRGINVNGMRIANYNIKPDNFYFSPGRWSLSASSGSTLGCFDFSPTDYKFDYKAAQKQAVLTVDGKISVMDGQLSAGCGLDIVANVDGNKRNLSFNSMKYSKAKFDSEFGGITMKGSLEPFDGDDNGYNGEVEFALPGGFLPFKARGAFFKYIGETENLAWGYFRATKLLNTGLRLDPIAVDILNGGIYLNCRSPRTVGDIPTANLVRKGVNGVMLGLGITTTGIEILSANMDLAAVYDSNRRKLSPIYLTGTIDSLMTSTSSMATVNDKCQLAYVNDKAKYFEINVTANGGATLDSDTKNGFYDLTWKNLEAGRIVRDCNSEAPLNFKVTMDKTSRSKWDLTIGKKENSKKENNMSGTAPCAPVIKHIEVDHPDERHAYATIFFEVDTVEADVKGYLPLYRHDRIMNGEWHPLTNSFTSPGGTVMRVDVSGLPTGEVCVASYNENGYQGASVPQMILLEDYLPPSAPTNLRADVSPSGRMELCWDASPESDVAFYEVFAANDTVSTFMNRSNDRQTATVFIDTLALGLNQPYIYYKVRAVDFSGNSSADSDTLRVVRPNLDAPSACRIDSLWMTDDAITMQWIQSNEADLSRHRLLRRLETDNKWTLLAVFDADSLRLEGNRIRVSDSPKPNMRTRYIYAVETTNLSGKTLVMSMPQTFLFTGPRQVNVPLKLFGNFTRNNNETLLVWETGQAPDYGPWNYCIYRKGVGDSDFRYLLSAKSTDSQFSDYLLRPGQEAEYYIVVQYADGRCSQRSNVVKVTAR